jgi:hypothetical protein
MLRARVYTHGQQGNSNHAVATCSFTWIELPVVPYPLLCEARANPVAPYF